MEISFKEAFTYMFKDEKFKQKYLIGTAFCLFFVISTWFLCSKMNFFTPFGGSAENFISPYGSASGELAGTEFLSLFANMMLGYLGIFIGSIIMLFSIGYGIEYAKQKISTGSDELPEWKGNLGKMFLNGLKMYGGTILFYFPSVILLEIIWLIIAVIFIIIGALLTAVFQIPFESAEFGILFVVMAIIAFVILFAILFGYIMFFQMAFSSFLVDTNPLSFFNFKRIGALAKNNLSNMFIIALFFIPFAIIYTIVFFVSLNIYFILSLIFQFYFLLVVYNLLAQYTQLGMKKYLTRMEAERQKAQQE